MCRGIWSLSSRESWLIANKPQAIKILKWPTRLSQCAGITKAWTKMAASPTYRTKLQMKMFITNNTNNYHHSNSRSRSSTGHTAKINSSNTAIREHSSSRNTKRICHTKPTLLKWHNQIFIKMMQASHNSIFSWIPNSKWQTSSETFSLWPSRKRSRRTFKNQYHHQVTRQGTRRATSHQFHRKEKCHTTSENSQSMEPVDHQAHTTTETTPWAHKTHCSTTGLKAKPSQTANTKPWRTRMDRQAKALADT